MINRTPRGNAAAIHSKGRMEEFVSTMGKPRGKIKSRIKLPAVCPDSGDKKIKNDNKKIRLTTYCPTHIDLLFAASESKSHHRLLKLLPNHRQGNAKHSSD
jgi:hypothetical protein